MIRFHHQEEPVLSAGNGGQQFLDPDMAVHAVESQREHPCADKDEHDEGRKRVVAISAD